MGKSLKTPILLVEDNDDDAMLIQRTLKSAGVTNPVHRLSDGDAAILYLRKRIKSRIENSLPKLVLLDLRMSGIQGLEVLQWIRQQPALARLRVVVLTVQNDLREVNRAYALGANSFLVKPLEIEDAQSFRAFLNAHVLGPIDSSRLPLPVKVA